MPEHSSTPENLAAIAAVFSLPGRFLHATRHGSGHINDTFCVTVAAAGRETRFIFQRINERVFRNVPALMENVERVTRHAREQAETMYHADAARRVLKLVSTTDGRPSHRDDAGGWWRCYEFIERARTFDVIESPALAREAARAFGKFQGLLLGLPGPRLHETIPNFHHTRKRFEALQRAIAADPHGRAAGVRNEIAFARAREPLVDTLLRLQAQGRIPERITHNDTKLNNVMIDDATQEGLCVIDLDTVMPGLALYDFGDMVRSATNSAAEDERDLTKVHARLPIFEALVEGYLATARPFLTAVELSHVIVSGQLITFEIGLRFLTDHLEGDVYFRTHRPGHNLDRARNQFALLRSLENQRDAMEVIVQRFSR